MIDILKYIDEMQVMYGDKDPSSMDQEPRPMFADGQLVQPNDDGSRPGYQGDDVVSGYSEKARKANKIKFEKTLKEMLDEINGLTEKGYGNVTNIVEKYSNKLGLSKDKVQKYYNKDGTFKSFNFNQEQRKIRGAVIAEAKELNLIDMPNNMIKAVEDYKKLGKEIPRGMPQKIIKANKVPESQFYKTLNKINLFVKQKKKFKNIDAKKKFYQDQRAAALKEYSSDGFERMTRGSKTIQGGHTGDIYNEFVTTSTKAYTPAKINMETLTDVDATLKAIGLKRDAAIKAKNFAEVERLNTKGINLSAATEGYKTFKVVQPDGSNYIYGIDQKKTTDPMNLTNNIKVQELTSGKDKEFNLAKKRFEAKQITAEEFEIARAKAEKKLFDEGRSKELIKVQKKDAMKNAKISKKEINRISKQVTAAMGELACPTAKLQLGGRVNFSNGSTCVRNGRKILERIVATGKGTKAELSMAKKILNFGKGALSLKGLVGPQALAAEALLAAGFVGYDVAAGKPLKEAIGKNLNAILGPKWKQDVEAMEFERLKGSGVDIDQLKQLSTAYKQADSLQSLYDRQYSLEQNKNNLDLESFEGVDMQSRKDELKQINMTINELNKPGGFNVQGNITETINDSNILRNKDMATDILGAQEANRSKLPKFNTAPIFDERYTNKKMDEMKELYPSYTDQEINELYTGYGRDPKELNYKYTPINFPGDTSSKPVTGRDDVRDYFKIQDQTQNIADAGGVANMAGGGIAGLSGGDPEGAMTKSMNPDSQGLRSLFNNGKKR